MDVGKPINSIRKYIHQHPELSREEKNTADFIASFFKNLSGFHITRNLGYHGMVISRKFGDGPAIAFRAELDALPIQELSKFKHVSQNKGVSHACGHDGHISILLNLARKLNATPPNCGTVYFLFQSAEETGEGAKAMVESKAFATFKINRCYALHNIPGRASGTVYSKVGSFACASVGCTAKITGKTAHAAHPEDAINPIEIAVDFLTRVKKLPSNAALIDFALVTPIALNAGEKAFGTSPAYGEIRITMRSELTEYLDFMIRKTQQIAAEIADESGAQIDVSFEEYFPATMNSDLLPNLQKACQHAEVSFEKMTEPFRWSEDFSRFAKAFPILMFGLGSGKNTPPLHAPTFDFPNPLIQKGSEVFYELYLNDSAP